MSTKKKVKLKSYSVSVNVNVNSEIIVKAKDKKQARKLAMQAYSDNWKDDSHHGLDYPCVDVDFAYEEYIEESDEEDG